MPTLVAGLVVFFAAHLLPTFPAARAGLVQRLGANGYRVAFALVSLAGLALIVVGKGDAPFVPVWTPPAFMRHLTMLLMLPVFVLLLATYVPCNIRRFVRHPMILAVKAWALAHLLVNGDLASMLLFGAFLAWGVYDLVSVKKRDTGEPRPKKPVFYDVGVVLGGLVVYALVARYHGSLFGIAIMG